MIRDFIDSGVLETFVLGYATEEESAEVLRMAKTYPEVKNALQTLEADMEVIASNMAITPPPTVWNRIEKEIDEIILREQKTAEPIVFRERLHGNGHPPKNSPQFIEVEAASSHMRIHKVWRWIFAAVFVLGKIFLAFAIYYYLENRQMNEQVNELKTELKQLKSTK